MLEKTFFPRPINPERYRHLAEFRTYSERKLQTNWLEPDAIVLMGENAIDNGDVEFARRCMRRVVEIQPDHSRAWLWLGVISQDPEEAISCYERAIKAFEKRIEEIQQQYQQRIDSGHKPEITLGGETATQTEGIRRAKEGIAFEKKRMMSSSNSHIAVARVRQRNPKAKNICSHCVNERKEVVRRFWGWVPLLGFAGTFFYKIRFPDGNEGYAKDNETLIDIVPREEPIDERNVLEDPANVESSLTSEVLGLVKRSPQEAINLILKRVQEIKRKLELPDLWYERAGDIAYMNGDISMAHKLWAKAKAELKLRYLFAKRPEDIDADIMKAYAEEFAVRYVVPSAKPEFYSTDPDPDDYWDKGPNRVQRLYAEEIATAFKDEIRKWQSENKMTFLDFLISQVQVEAYAFFFGFPLTDYRSTQNGYIPTIDSGVLYEIDKWRIDAENKVRRVHGLPLRGSLISETLLYEIVKQILDGIEVVRQNEAWKYIPWLRPQHVDIFVPKLNLAIEYQGEQHFRPVEHFGGEEGYQETVKRDQRKRELLEKHNITLICVTPENTLSPEAIRRLLEPFLESKSSGHIEEQ